MYCGNTIDLTLEPHTSSNNIKTIYKDISCVAWQQTLTMLIYVAGLSQVSNCFSVGPLVQGLTLAERSENLLCGFRDIDVFYPSTIHRKNVLKTSGPIINVTKKDSPKW